MTPIRLLGFSAETTRARREGRDIVNAMKEKNRSTRVQYPEKLSFRNEGQMLAKSKTEGVRTTRTALQEMLKGVLQA